MRQALENTGVHGVSLKQELEFLQGYLEGGRIFFLKIEEIDWIEAAGNYVKLHAGQTAHLVRDTLSRLEAKLDPRQFLRIHRSMIVRIDRISA